MFSTYYSKNNRRNKCFLKYALYFYQKKEGNRSQKPRSEIGAKNYAKFISIGKEMVNGRIKKIKDDFDWSILCKKLGWKSSSVKWLDDIWVEGGVKRDLWLIAQLCISMATGLVWETPSIVDGPLRHEFLYPVGSLERYNGRPGEFTLALGSFPLPRGIAPYQELSPAIGGALPELRAIRRARTI